MSIALILSLALPACTPSGLEPEWPVDLASIAPRVARSDPGPGGLGHKCELDMFGLPPDLAPLVQRALTACRTDPPALEAAAAYRALFLAMRAIPRRTFEVRSMQSFVVMLWQSEERALAPHLTRSTMRPAARCVDPMP